MVAFPSDSRSPASRSLAKLQGWKLEDAETRLGEVVQLARETAPQRIVVQGKDAVVILSAEDFAKQLPLLEQPSLHKLVSESPLSRLEFEQPGMPMPVREIEL